MFLCGRNNFTAENVNKNIKSRLIKKCSILLALLATLLIMLLLFSGYGTSYYNINVDYSNVREEYDGAYRQQNRD